MSQNFGHDLGVYIHSSGVIKEIIIEFLKISTSKISVYNSAITPEKVAVFER